MEEREYEGRTIYYSKIDVAVMQDIIRTLNTTAFGVYAAILSYRNSETNECCPSIAQIGEEYNISGRTVKDNLNRLYEAGFLDIDSGAKHKCNSYFFPKETFYKDWANDYAQSHAKRRKNKKDKSPVAGIYLITNTETGTQYVGQAVNIRSRWIQHIQDLRTNSHCNKALQEDFNKYGEDAFDFKVLEIVEDSPVLDIELDRKENKWGKKYHVLEEGYNKAHFIDPFKQR